MAQSPLSMFDVQPTLSYADQARQQQQAAMQYAQLSGPQQSQYNMFTTAAGMAQPVADIARAGVAAATGQPVDNPNAKIANTRAEAQAALSQVDASDPTQVYPALIRVLQKNGMVAQAMALQKEFEDIQNKRRDDARAVTKDEETARLRQLEIESRDPRSPLAKTIEAYQKVMAARDAAPEGSPQRATADAAVRAFEAQLMKEGRVRVDKTNTEMIVTDAKTGAFIKSYPMGAKQFAPKGDGSAATAPKNPQPLKDAYGVAQVDGQGNQIYKGTDGSLWTLGANGWEAAGQGAQMGQDTSDRSLRGQDAKKVATNQATIATITRLQKKLADPAVRAKVGPQAYANRWFDFADRFDTAGVPIRSELTNLMSSVLHARSGAAVTVQEFDRLRGFLPQPTDGADVVLQKLQSMVNVATDETNALRGMRGVTGQQGSTRSAAPAGAASTGKPSFTTSNWPGAK